MSDVRIPECVCFNRGLRNGFVYRWVSRQDTAGRRLAFVVSGSLDILGPTNKTFRFMVSYLFHFQLLVMRGSLPVAALMHLFC
jgi:hypothetical protein